MQLTLRSRAVVVALALTLLSTVVAAIAGAYFAALIGVPFALLLAWLARRSLHLGDRGVRYRGMFPSEDFEASWDEIVEVALDVVSTSTPGSPGSPALRARFGRRDGPSRSATLFSVRDGDAIVEACRARGVPVVDERGARSSS